MAEKKKKKKALRCCYLSWKIKQLKIQSNNEILMMENLSFSMLNISKKKC